MKQPNILSPVQVFRNCATTLTGFMKLTTKSMEGALSQILHFNTVEGCAPEMALATNIKGNNFNTDALYEAAFNSMPIRVHNQRSLFKRMLNVFNK